MDGPGGEEFAVHETGGGGYHGLGPRAPVAWDSGARVEHYRPRDHTPENIENVIDYAVSHDTEFHQFMLYTPIPGTPLYAEHEANDTLLNQTVLFVADIHGQLKFNYQHPHIRNGEETEFLLRAFQRDFEVNGPSVVRIIRTILRGGNATSTTPIPASGALCTRGRQSAHQVCGGSGRHDADTGTIRIASN